jgi:hypothetical protein
MYEEEKQLKKPSNILKSVTKSGLPTGKVPILHNK